MKRHFFISDDLNDLDAVEAELEARGLAKPQIHVFTNDDAGVDTHKNLHNMEAVLKKDVVHGTELGAVIGVIGALMILIITWLAGWHETATWIPFIFLAIVVLGFCTWEGGFMGIQETHHDFRRFKAVIESGRHVFFVDVHDDQLPILNEVVARHPSLEKAGTGTATPELVVVAQRKWKDFMRTMP